MSIASNLVSFAQRLGIDTEIKLNVPNIPSEYVVAIVNTDIGVRIILNAMINLKQNNIQKACGK